MKFLLRILLEITYAIGLLVVGIIAGNILYRLIGDLFSPIGIDRSNDAATGAGILFALMLLIGYILVRIIRRRKKNKQPT
jgi:hypothetical protein